MSDAVLIVGDYGAAGSVIASVLVQHHANQLIIAGRNQARAAKIAAELEPRVHWRVLDVTKPLDYDEVLASVRCVVLCLDLPNLEFARQCFQRSIHLTSSSCSG